MRQKYALSIDPTIFPQKMKTQIFNGNQMATTQDIARYLGVVHTWVFCTLAWVKEEINKLSVQTLSQFCNEYECVDINLALQDNIDLHSNQGYLIDQFTYALVLRCMEASDFLVVLKQLLQQRQHTIRGESHA